MCYECRLVVEIDDGQHTNSLTDKSRDDFLAKEGFCAVRYWNNDVLKISEGVIIDLLQDLH